MSAFVPEVAPLSRRQIEGEAIELIRLYYPHLLRKPGPFPTVRFFEDLLPERHYLITGVAELPLGVEGMAWPDGQIMLSEETYRGMCRGEGRPRFTTVHEGYHGMRHIQQIRRVLVHSSGLTLYRRSAVPSYRDPEWQANVFAGAALMPYPAVQELARSVGAGMLAETMRETFQVSASAVEVRLKTLIQQGMLN